MANDEKVLEYFSAFFDDEEGDEEYVPVEEWKQVGAIFTHAQTRRIYLHAREQVARKHIRYVVVYASACVNIEPAYVRIRVAASRLVCASRR